MFESFHQVDNSIARSRGGSGLGLTISRQLVELMGGKIGVDSEVGRGSRFVRCGVPEANETAPRQLAKPMRVLLVDTNAVSAHVISLYLGSWNVEVTAASTLHEAVQAGAEAVAAQQVFDAAIIDAKGLGEAAITLADRLRDDGATPAVVLLIGMDGTLSDEALDGVGAVDMFTKPARPNDLFDVLSAIAQGEGSDAAARKAAKRNAQARRAQFDARILVAEDNPVNQDVALGLLQALGCRVVTAPNGRSAVQSFAQEKFDLILMDCEMPIVDGLEATKRIRQLEELEKAQGGGETRIPIIALTAHALADIHESCLAAGMDDFLTKPFDEAQIVAALRRWIAPLEREATDRYETADKPIPATKSRHRCHCRHPCDGRQGRRRLAEKCRRKIPYIDTGAGRDHPREIRLGRCRSGLAHGAQPQIERGCAGGQASGATLRPHREHGAREGRRCGQRPRRDARSGIYRCRRAASGIDSRHL